MSDAEEFYVAARVLEEVAKSEEESEAAAVYGRAAETARNGGAEKAVEAVAEDAESEAEKRAVERLRLALGEVRSDGSAHLTENVDDRLVASLRSEY